MRSSDVAINEKWLNKKKFMSQRELQVISFDEMPVDKHPLESVSEK